MDRMCISVAGRPVNGEWQCMARERQLHLLTDLLAAPVYVQSVK